MEAKNEPIWLQYMPDYVDLYYVDYRDDLKDHIGLLEDCIQKNNFYPLSESVYDFWDFPEETYLNEIQNRMEKDDLLDEYEENEDEIRDWLVEHDTSDPVKDLLRNTGPMIMFYSLGVELDAAEYIGGKDMWGNDSFAQATYKIRRALGIKKDESASEIVDKLVADSYYGGELRIYFIADIEDLISGNPYAETKDDFKSIQIKGETVVAIHDSVGGSGDFDFVNLDLSLPFKRENLHISRIEKYDLESVYGTDAGCIKTSGTVTFSEAPAKRRKINTSSTNKKLSVEAQYNKIYKEGGCTFGDMDMHRHRDVYYRNDYPCGCKCPHCGTFWID